VTRRPDPQFHGFSSYTVEHRYTGNVELLLPTPLVEAFRLEQQVRVTAAEAARQVKEEEERSNQRSVGSAATASATLLPDRDSFVMAFERHVASRQTRRSHPVLRGDELYRVMARVSTLRDRDYQKRELELAKKLEKAGALREVVNPVFRAAKWERSLSSLRASYPHFSSVTNFVAGCVALSARSRRPLKLPPMHLWGNPGLGKTQYANDLATALGAPLRRHSMENAQTTSLLLGGERHWSTASHGLVFEQVCLGAVANPVFLIDELDKAPKGAQYDPLAPLHSLLEPLTAQRVRDASLDIEFDASLVTYMATSNDPGKIPESLRSRFREFHILPPTGSEALRVSEVVAVAAARQLDVPGFARPDAALCRQLAHLTAREIHQVVQDAVARALQAGRRHLTLADMPPDVVESRESPSTLH
jgi:ATP-dependent Lon protease